MTEQGYVFSAPFQKVPNVFTHQVDHAKPQTDDQARSDEQPSNALHAETSQNLAYSSNHSACQ